MNTRMTIVAAMTRGRLTDVPTEANVRTGVEYSAGWLTGTYSSGGISIPVDAKPLAEPVIIAVLEATTGVTDYTDDRIYPWSEVPQDAALPYITVYRVSSDHAHHMTASGGMVVTTLQIDAWAVSYTTAKELAEAIRLAIDGYTGTVTTSDGDLEVRMCHLQNQDDSFESDINGMDRRISRVSSDYIVGHAEAVPLFS